MNISMWLCMNKTTPLIKHIHTQSPKGQNITHSIFKDLFIQYQTI